MQQKKSQPTSSKRNTPVFYLVTIVITLFLILLIGELGSRFLYHPHSIPAPPPDSSINPYRPNPYFANMRPYIFFHIPGAAYSQKLFTHENRYTINSMGFRGNDFSHQADRRTKRLVVIGDSMVEGHGVQLDESFPAILNRKLAHWNWEVLNLGVQGASPIYFAANLERYLYLNPDALLLVIHENDLYDDELREQLYFDLPVLDNRAALYTGGTANSLSNISMLWRLLNTSFHTLTRNRLEQIIQHNAKIPRIHASRKSDREMSSFAVPADKFDQRWELSSRYLTFTAETLQEQGVPLMVSSLCTVTMAMADVREYAEHCQRLENGVHSWAAQHDIPYISLIPTMKKALDDHKTKEVLLVNDFHPTPFTHNLLADELIPFIEKNIISVDSADE